MALARSAFQACCGLNIVYGFGATGGDARTGLTKDQLFKQLTQQVKAMRGSIGALIVAFNSHQMGVYADWMREFGFDQLNEQPYAHPGHKDHSGEVLWAYRLRNADFSLREPTWVEPPPPEHSQGVRGKWKLKYPGNTTYFYNHTYGWLDRYSSQKPTLYDSYLKAEEKAQTVGGEVVEHIDPALNDDIKVKPGMFGGGAADPVAVAPVQRWGYWTVIRNRRSRNEYRVTNDYGNGRIDIYNPVNGRQYNDVEKERYEVV